MISINMKKFISFQHNEKKEETIYVIRGVLVLYIKNRFTGNIKKESLGPGESYHIQPKTIYKLSAELGDVSLACASSYCLNDPVLLEENVINE